MDADIARFAFNHNAFARVFVQRPAFVFERGKHGRHLADGAGEAGAGCLEGFGGHGAIGRGDDVAFGITRGGGFAQLHGGGVGFVGIEQVLGKLGRFAEANRQQAAGERVEYARVPRFLRAK